ncbi:hypothetical protein [Prevotella denticola]|uniref:hypothetical protein n=1 Tax=Prevotella denticola TaxID=28129 RepID=UPI001C5EFCE6|nr:hypothetical protein [Prevotella denticola]
MGARPVRPVKRFEKSGWIGGLLPKKTTDRIILSFFTYLCETIARREGFRPMGFSSSQA